VVIDWLVQPFVPVKVTAPTPPLLILVSERVGSLLLVKLQVKSEPALTLAAGMVSTLLTSVPMVPVLPVMAELASVQDADAKA
jgi:hypothetical protein